ncbi:MAG TPA: DUF1987 domain-containing protein [Desulfuromonadales bacterium]|nr:DUF1987 domain-containing protein [Desulfuromonadales bacterium]
MEPLHIQQTSSTPLIQFNTGTGTLHISGESYPENSFDFFEPVISWLKIAVTECNELSLDIAITYMNSSSTKCTFDIIDILEEAFERGVKTSIVWRYDRENPRSYEMAEDFRDEVTFPFEIEAIEL